MIRLVLLALVLTLSSEGAVKKAKASAPAPYLRRVSMHLGSGLFIIDKDVHLGGELGFLVRLSDATPIFLGIDSGAYGMGTTVGTNNFFPVMATFLTRFNVHNSALHPILGISAGALFEQIGNDEEGSQSLTHFIGMARGGVEIDLAPSFSLSLEPRVGFAKEKLIFNPVIGVTIGL